MKAYKGGKSSQSQKKTDPNLLRVIAETEKKTGKTAANESAIKYSHMLLELIRPYHSDPPYPDEVEDFLEMGTVAWNMANMKKLMPAAFNTMWRETKKQFAGDPEAKKLLEKLIQEKTRKFEKYDMFIHDAQLNNSKDGFFVTVTAKPLEAFLAEGLANEEDDEDEGFNFEPGYINRNAFTVKPKQPFYDWLKKIQGNSLFPIETVEPHVFLIDERSNNREVELWLKENYGPVFTIILHSWFAEEKNWPQNRSYQLFNEWFEVSYQSMIFDLENFPVDKT